MLLGEVLQVALAERDRGLDPDLALALAGHADDVTELPGLVIDLDAVVEELLERCAVEDTIRGRAREVDEVLLALAGGLGGGLGGLDS